MSKDKKEQNLTHTAPHKGPETSEPGLGDLAPQGGGHKPAAEPTPPGKQPTAPGSLKAPATQNSKLEQLD